MDDPAGWEFTYVDLFLGNAAPKQIDQMSDTPQQIAGERSRTRDRRAMEQPTAATRAVAVLA